MKENILNKFADDTYLIIAAERVTSRDMEIKNIEDWAVRNNLKLNRDKSYEIVFTKTGTKCVVETLAPHPTIKRVNDIKALDVTMSCDLSMSALIYVVIASSSQTLFALQTHYVHMVWSLLLFKLYSLLSRWPNYNIPLQPVRFYERHES